MVREPYPFQSTENLTAYVLTVGIPADNDAHDSGIRWHAEKPVRPILIQRFEVATLALDNEPLECHLVSLAQADHDVFAMDGRDIAVDVNDVTMVVVGLHGFAGHPQGDDPQAMPPFRKSNPVRGALE